MSIQYDFALDNTNCRLSAIRSSDRDAFVKYLNDVEFHNDTEAIPFPYTYADADSWLNTLEAIRSKNGCLAYWVIRNSEDELIGNIIFHDYHLNDDKPIEIGYWLAKPYWGRQIMGAVIKTVCEYGFQSLGIKRFEAMVFTHNDRSQRILTKSRFRHDRELDKDGEMGFFLDNNLDATKSEDDMSIRYDFALDSVKCRLSEFRNIDRDALVLHLNDVDIYKNTGSIPYPYSLTDADNWLNTLGVIRDRNGCLAYWAIRNSDHELIGNIFFHDYHLNDDKPIEIGYWLAKPYWGRQIMGAAIKTVCEYGFQTLGIKSFEAIVFAYNDRSQSVLAKSGFRHDRVLERYSKKDGELHDVIVFVLDNNQDQTTKIDKIT